MARYSTARLEEIDELDGGQNKFRPVRHHFGITTFGVIASSARSDGDLLIKEHDESHPAGTFVHVPVGIRRAAFAEEAGTTVLAIGAGPSGKPYEPSGWELAAPLFALYESGEYAEAADRAQVLLADDPPYGPLYDNAACFESRAGRTDAAIVHLRRAVELAPHLAQLARDDDDLTALVTHDDFAAIVRS